MKSNGPKLLCALLLSGALLSACGDGGGDAPEERGATEPGGGSVPEGASHLAGGGGEVPGMPGVPAAGGGGAPPAGAGSAMEQMKDSFRKLERGEVEGYLAALSELKQLGLDLEQELGEDPSAYAQMAAGFQVKGEWAEVLEKHGLGGTTFHDVHLNVMMALGAVEMQANRAEAEESMKAMEQYLTPEQRAQMMAAFSYFDDVPPENVKLIEGFKSQLESALR